jgi:hypothetical protein
MYVKTQFKPIRAIVGPTIPSTDAGVIDFITSTAYGTNFQCTIMCTTGQLAISTVSTAPTTSIGYLLGEGKSLDLLVPSYLSILGNSTTAAYQCIIWDY